MRQLTYKMYEVKRLKQIDFASTFDYNLVYNKRSFREIILMAEQSYASDITTTIN